MGVGLGQLFDAQRVPALFSKDVRTPCSAFPPWGLWLDLRGARPSGAGTEQAPLMLLDLSWMLLSALGTGSFFFSTYVLM